MALRASYARQAIRLLMMEIPRRKALSILSTAVVTAINRMQDGESRWQGTAINPFAMLAGKRARSGMQPIRFSACLPLNLKSRVADVEPRLQHFRHGKSHPLEVRAGLERDMSGQAVVIAGH